MWMAVYLLLSMFSISQSLQTYAHSDAKMMAELQKLINPPESSPDTFTWLGADGATSVRWNSTRYIWLFGDTILGRSLYPVRKPSAFLHNSVGIINNDSEDGSPKWQPMVKYHKIDADGTPRPIFADLGYSKYVWPLSGVRVQDKLFIIGTVSDAHNKDLNVQGSIWLLVKNPEDTPNQWEYDAQEMPCTNSLLTWSSAIVLDDSSGWIYIYGEQMTTSAGSRKRAILCRIRPDDVLSMNWEKREYWSNNTWCTGDDCSLTGLPNFPPTSETVITKSGNRSNWLMLQIPGMLSRELQVYKSGSLTGPWEVVMTRPLYLPWNSSNPDQFYFYAAKLHPEFSSNGKLIATYVINAINGSFLWNVFPNPTYKSLYIPLFVELDTTA